MNKRIRARKRDGRREKEREKKTEREREREREREIALRKIEKWTVVKTFAHNFDMTFSFTVVDFNTKNRIPVYPSSIRSQLRTKSSFSGINETTLGVFGRSSL